MLSHFSRGVLKKEIFRRGNCNATSSTAIFRSPSLKSQVTSMAAGHLVLLLVFVSAYAAMAGPSAFLHDNWGLSLHHLRVANVSFRTTEETNPCEELENGNTVCKNCKTVIFCIDKKAYEAPCSEDQICEGDSPTVECVAASDGGGEAGAPQTRSDTNCKCEEGDQGFVADPFDKSSYLVCSSGELKTCSEGKIFNPEEEKCEEEGEGGGGNQECTEMGVFPVLPDCKAYYTCFETDGGLESTKETPCNENEIFNEEAKDCKAKEDDPGETKCTGFGMFKDNYECNKYLLCVGADKPPSKIICCEDGKVFDADTKGCVEPASMSAPVTCLGECALNSFGVTPDCLASTASSTTLSSRDMSVSTPTSSSSSSPSTDTSASTGTSTASTDASSDSTDSSSSTGSTDSSSVSTGPSTSASPEIPTCTAQGTIPYPGDCSKYYTCRKLSSGEWEIREFKCPGSLLFSPSKLFCTLPENVPECA